MRKVSLVLVAVLLLSTGSMFAADSKKEAEPSKTISKQIGEILSNNYLNDTYDGAFAQVLFMLNDSGEIVVISVDTKKEALEGFIKSTLNYKKIDFKQIEEGKKYTVSVRIAS